MNRLDTLAIIYRTTPFEYRGYKFKHLENDVFNNSLHCFAERPEWQEKTKNEHGEIKLVVHPSDSFYFNIAYEQFELSDLDELQTIWERFKSEVDYYLDKSEEPEIIDSKIKKYICTCCGTELTTSEEGYTPQCKNCGALMHLV